MQIKLKWICKYKWKNSQISNIIRKLIINNKKLNKVIKALYNQKIVKWT